MLLMHLIDYSRKQHSCGYHSISNALNLSLTYSFLCKARDIVMRVIMGSRLLKSPKKRSFILNVLILLVARSLVAEINISEPSTDG